MIGSRRSLGQPTVTATSAAHLADCPLLAEHDLVVEVLLLLLHHHDGQPFLLSLLLLVQTRAVLCLHLAWSHFHGEGLRGGERTFSVRTTRLTSALGGSPSRLHQVKTDSGLTATYLHLGSPVLHLLQVLLICHLLILLLFFFFFVIIIIVVLLLLLFLLLLFLSWG